MALTNHQQVKFEESLAIVERSKRLLIKGSAGVGKTFLVDTIVEVLSGRGNIYCTAPTNKAVAVLRGKVKEYTDLSFLTTHAALKLKRVIDYKSGDISFKPSYDNKYPPLQHVKILIVDEASMLNSDLLDSIEVHASKNNTLVIFIGDDKQLNPVNEEVSPVFTRDYPVVELTEIVRQGAGNPIITLSRSLGDINSKVESRTDIGGYIYTYDEDKIIETLARVNGTDELKYLAYTNAEVDRVNKLVRQRIYGTPSKIEENETLIFNSPYKETYFTNQELLVEKIRVVSTRTKFLVNKDGVSNVEGSANPMFKYMEMKYYSINPTYIPENEFSAGGWVDNILVIHEDSEREYKEIIKEMAARAKVRDITWVDYYEFIEQFADVTYNHAITVHKSQGSTYKQVIVNLRNLKVNRNTQEFLRLLYTAITRASDLLIIYKA